MLFAHPRSSYEFKAKRPDHIALHYIKDDGYRFVRRLRPTEIREIWAVVCMEATLCGSHGNREM